MTSLFYVFNSLFTQQIYIGNQGESKDAGQQQA